MTKPDQLPVQQGKQSLWTLQKYALDKHAIVAITDLQGRITAISVDIVGKKFSATLTG